MLEGAVAIEGPTESLTRDDVTEAYFGLRAGRQPEARLT